MIAPVENHNHPSVDPVVEQFNRAVVDSPARFSPDWLSPIRRVALEKFSNSGYPSQQHEDWRFTNVSPLIKLPFRPKVEPSANGTVSVALEEKLFGKISGPRLVFIDGHFSKQLSRPGTLPDGATVTGFSTGHAELRGFLEKSIERSGSNADNSFADLNTAFFRDGAIIHVPANTRISEPIHLVFLATTTEPGATFHVRNLIAAEAGAEVTVLESFLSIGGHSYVTNSFSEFLVEDNASVEHVKFQDESIDAFHIATLHSTLGSNCRYISHSFALGGQLSRNTIRSKLNGPGLECTFNGLYLTRDDQTADHHMIIDHAEPNCASHEYFNGILDDRSKGVFHGRILVRPKAQKTDAKQTNKNILLSDSATVDAKPQLEIYADDVKCTHGATVGQLNEDSVFYLRSRGIGQETARRMLIHSFAGEIIDRVKCEPVRQEIDRVVWNRLEQNHHLSGSK